MSVHSEPNEDNSDSQLSEFAQEVLEEVMEDDLDDQIRPNKGTTLTDKDRKEALSNFCKGDLKHLLGSLLNKKKNESHTSD